jgi:predicted Rossmann fold flavoprotein
MTYDVIVIGGGASGMLAAGRAAENGSRVLLLERNDRLGKKLSITGKGRCNLTNSGETADFIANYGKNGRFLYRALTRFSNHDLVAFFNRHGVATKEERGGRIFPATDDSESVVRALERYLKKHRVTIRLRSRVERILIDSASGAVAGVAIGKAGETVAGRAVILATGGLSYPATGSTGDGYSMAGRLGHTIVPPRPALVPLETEERFPRDLQGLSLENVTVTAFSNDRKIASEFGDMLFTHFGVSGPIILKLSGLIVERLGARERVAVSINLKPALDERKLDNRLIREFAAAGRKSIRTVMRNLLPKALVPVFLASTSVPGDKRCNQITGGERAELVRRLTDFRLRVRRARPIDEAIITRGGVDLKEIESRTMESRKVKGLYFCGEIVDIDGSTGGYNLQAAFSTAHLAALAAAGQSGL